MRDSWWQIWPEYDKFIPVFHLLYWPLVVPGLGFAGGSDGKESTCNAGDLDLISGLSRSPGEGKGYPLQYSGLENFLDCIVHVVTKSRTWLSDFHFHFSERRKITPRGNQGKPKEMRASLVAQMVKSLPALRETQVWFLGQEDPLEKEMAIHSCTLAWKIPWTVHRVAKSRTRLSDFTSSWTAHFTSCASVS